MLHEFLTEQRERLIARCERTAASRRTSLPPSSREDHGIPLFLDQLIETARTHRESSSEIGEAATRHGGELLLRFAADQVVHNSGDVRQAVSELAGELEALITTDEFRTLNHCLDDMIADAVTESAFEQRGADRSGLGLGLAICKRGVEANGGMLAVRDVPGKGCVFRVELPRTLALVDAN